jgi:GT2 family glycosyltransferase
MVHKGCESCREWQEHYYWEHMDVSTIRFFKLMTGDFAKGTVSVHSLLLCLFLRQIFHC